MRQHRLGRSHGVGPTSRWASPRRPASRQAHRLPVSAATALQEMGILQPEGLRMVPSPTAGSGLWAVWQEIEAWPRSVLLLMSLTCFLLLAGLIAWQPWQ